MQRGKHSGKPDHGPEFDVGALAASHYLRQMRTEQGDAIALDAAKGLILAAASILARASGADEAARYLALVTETVKLQQQQPAKRRGRRQ